ncbi:hypothetical protein [Limnobacter parvus]|uniref:DUF4148 domain-containing protein n=1 Tax=Limnobacter parvus TaxID=2939690 RepID=A0ABT1XIV2_9BURK|nr:hypothetical protein [Limnobacter parvus]MCR2747210.1 hypothetical protein [Limnobacter parvus]
MKFHYLVALPLLGVALPVHSETAAQTFEYQSAFEGYQAYSDPEIQNWPKVNRLVEEIGGWRVYAREPYESKAENNSDNPEKGAAPTGAANPPAAKPHQHGGAQ